MISVFTPGPSVSRAARPGWHQGAHVLRRKARTFACATTVPTLNEATRGRSPSRSANSAAPDSQRSLLRQLVSVPEPPRCRGREKQVRTAQPADRMRSQALIPGRPAVVHESAARARGMPSRARSCCAGVTGSRSRRAWRERLGQCRALPKYKAPGQQAAMVVGVLAAAAIMMVSSRAVSNSPARPAAWAG